MEKKSMNVSVLSIIVIASILVIPTYGIMSVVAEEKQENNVKTLQGWCCSWIEQEKDNTHTLSIPNTIANEYSSY